MSKKHLLKSNLDSLVKNVKSLTDLPVTIVAVSKYSEFEDIQILYDLGHRDFGENRIEDLQRKSQQARELNLVDIRWHFIGRIQSKKIKHIVAIDNLSCVHSIANKKHLDLFLKESRAQEKTIDCYLQVNCSGEPQKDGFLEVDSALVECISDHQYLNILGLMTMAPNREIVGDEEVSHAFRKLRSMRDLLNPELGLSMGMSGDYKLSLPLGASCIRVGSHIFK